MRYEVKSHYGDWKEVSKEEAEKAFDFWWHRMPNVPEKKRREAIERLHVRTIDDERLSI